MIDVLDLVGGDLNDIFRATKCKDCGVGCEKVEKEGCEEYWICSKCKEPKYTLQFK